MRQAGFTLIEFMFAVTVFGVAAAAMTQSFAQMSQRNANHEVRSGAIGAAQKVLDELRIENVTSLPSTGSTTTEVVYGGRTFSVQTTYCAIAAYCASNSIRHIRVGVIYREQTRYQVDTVFCQLR